MIASKAQQLDRKIRGDVLQCAVTALRMYQKTGKESWKQSADEFIAEAERLKLRIATHDYRAEDAEYALVEALDKRR